MEQIKKIIIIGSKGMAGHVIYYYLKQHTIHHIIDIARGTDFFTPTYNLDVTDFAQLTSILSIEKPDIVINCIGILNQDAENNPDKAVLLNSYFPHFLAKTGSAIGFKVIHISTDCVFNGKEGNYTENSIKNGCGFYAQTKALGELDYQNNFTIRTSIVGPELKSNGIGLFNWFMQQAGVIKGYTEAYWTGVTTLELAKAIDAAIAQNLKGLHHLVNERKISKFELINIFKETFNVKDLIIKASDDYKIDKSLVKTKNEFNYLVPGYQTMLTEMKDWMILNKKLYNQYKIL